MSEYRKMDATMNTGRGEKQFSRLVLQPRRSDGVGRALRRAYPAAVDTLPEELRILLARIDELCTEGAPSPRRK
jgi:hypothetical protein